MKKIYTSLLLIVCFSMVTSAQKIVGYIPQYRSISWMDNNIEWGSMTEAYYFGSLPVSNGGITIEQPARFQHVLDRSTEYGLNPWLSVGGWGKSTNFISIANNASNRQAFADEALRLCQVYNLKGVDIDWEFPAYGQEESFRDFFKTLYEKLHPEGYLVSAACGGEATHADKWLDETFDYIDDLNIMAYDAPTTVATSHASLQFMIDAMDIYHDQGCPYEKMLGGVAFYSRPTEKMYSEIIASSSNKEATFLNDGSNSIKYNGKNTIEDKIDYVMGKGGVGILIWEVTQDVKGQYSLLNAAHSKMEDYMCDIPKPDLGSDVSICGTTSVALDGSVSGSYSYSWMKNGVAYPGVSSTIGVGSPGVYQVTVSDGECSWSDEIEVLGVLPTITLGEDFELCTPSYATLNANVEGVGLDFEWRSDGSIIYEEETSQLNISRGAVYEVTVSALGCSSVSSSIEVFGDQLLDVDHQEICKDDPVTLEVNTTSSNAFHWFTTETSASSVFEGELYQIPSLSSTVRYFVEEIDPSGGICEGKPDWSASTTYGASNGFYKVVHDTKLWTNTTWWAQGVAYEPGVNDYWQEVGSCGSSCDRTVVDVFVTDCLPQGILDGKVNQQLFFFPNPVINLLNLEIDEEVSYEIVTFEGNVILNGYTNRSIDLASLEAGMYLVQIESSLGVKTSTFIKE